MTPCKALQRRSVLSFGHSQANLDALSDALQRQDTQKARQEAHSLKGASSAVGAKRLVALCQDLSQVSDPDLIDFSLYEITTELASLHDALRTFLRKRAMIEGEKGQPS